MQYELNELKQHSDWQMHRIKELQNTPTGEMIRTYDKQLSNLREAFEMEKRHLLAQLAQCRIKYEVDKENLNLSETQVLHCLTSSLCINLFKC